MKGRALRLVRWLTALLLAGGGYALFIHWTGLAIPCPIYTVTGLYCPGCGVSRFCLALLRLDFQAAFRSHAALFLLLPVGLLTAGFRAAGYVFRGKRGMSRWQTGMVWFMIGALAAFGILRNLPVFAFLAPA